MLKIYFVVACNGILLSVHVVISCIFKFDIVITIFAVFFFFFNIITKLFLILSYTGLKWNLFVGSYFSLRFFCNFSKLMNAHAKCACIDIQPESSREIY